MLKWTWYTSVLAGDIVDAVGAGDPANELVPVVAEGDVADLDGADGVDDFDAAGVWRAGELWALADVNGPSARIARAMNETINFMTTPSLFRFQ